ncbi:sodium:proton antiporter [Bacillus marinisedimentorum]|uniref:cation:proton antiporter n=1 Tax=Bacillus marinisedimentorum TaxID=1821260 RepID=UPI0007DF7884
MMDSFLVVLMIIGVLGVASQWAAWRFRFPAIVLMSVVGLLAGPFTGLIDPEVAFGKLYEPTISLAVAIILFEGSLNLDFREVRGLGKPVLRIVTIGAALAWLLGSLTAHYIAGLSWAVAFVIGGLFIVTGPTVILPLLRQASLEARPAKILKWEGIIVDPIGALLAVFAFEIIKFISSPGGELIYFLAASIFAIFFGWGIGKAVGTSFTKGLVPEYLKSPVVFILVLACFIIADEIAHETGLLAVTAMGMTLANMRLSSIAEMRHFKENLSILLTSAIFIMLTASLTTDTLLDIFNWNIVIFVLLMLFLVRPLSIFLATIKSGLSWQEKTLVGWIAPRGIVALTVSGYFSSILLDSGFEDATMLNSLTFALVFTTVSVHGISLGWLGRKLGLAGAGQPGVMIVGGNRFTTELAATLKDLKIPVMVVDSSWRRLYSARNRDVPYYHGDVLSEQIEYRLDMSQHEYLIAATEHDAYNTLVCTTYVPTLGRSNLYQVRLKNSEGEDIENKRNTIGGRVLFNGGPPLEDLYTKISQGFGFRKTTLSEEYTYGQYLKERSENTILMVIVKASGVLQFFTDETEIELKGEPGDTIISLAPPTTNGKKQKEKKLQSMESSDL